MLHDETENPVDMVKVVEGWLLIRTIPVPDDRKPLAGFDQVGADQQTGDEAVKLFQQHRFLAKGEQFLVKLLETARQTGHGRSNSMAAVREADPGDGCDACEHIGEPRLWTDELGPS
jgi:hypothetical protein